MAKKTLTIKVDITGARAVLAALNQLPKDANEEMRVASGNIAEQLAAAARRKANSAGPQGPLLVPTVKVVRDRVPVVQAGGSKRVGRNRAYAYKVLFGVEFGANFYPQFQKSHSSDGYWLFPLVRTESTMINREFNHAAEQILRKFGGGD